MTDTNELRKTRSALCNLTNRPLKRGISVISGGSELKSGDGHGRKVDIQFGDTKFAKKVCLFKGADFGIDGNAKGFPLPKGKEPRGSLSSNSSDTDASQDNRESFISSLRKEIKKANDLDGGRVHPSFTAEGGDASQESRESFISNLHIEIKKVEDLDASRVHPSVEAEGGDVTRDSSLSSVSRATCSGFHNKDCSRGVASNYQDDDLRHGSDATKTKSGLAHVPVVTVCKNSKEGCGADEQASTKCDPSEWSKFFMQSVKSRELGRCSTLKGDGGGNTDVNEECLKACSCSFCLKAAYIWADLQYQDIKGRISALKKSQKEANTLVHKSCTKEVDIHGRGNPIKSSSLESDLSGQWRSLFCHMEDILIQESTQLQASFLSLKDLRENCKMTLEMINEMPTEKQ